MEMRPTDDRYGLELRSIRKRSECQLCEDVNIVKPDLLNSASLHDMTRRYEDAVTDMECRTDAHLLVSVNGFQEWYAVAILSKLHSRPVFVGGMVWRSSRRL